jgi:hypothetical protein
MTSVYELQNKKKKQTTYLYSLIKHSLAKQNELKDKNEVNNFFS